MEELLRWTDLRNKKIKIFVSAYNGRIIYSTKIGRKDKEGKWIKQNLEITVNFNQDVIVNDQDELKILNGWITYYVGQNGYSKPLIIIKEFEKLGEVAFEQSDPELTLDQEKSSSDDDLPF